MVVALSFRRLARKVVTQSRRINATINAQIQESISGIVVAKSFRQERAIHYDSFRDNNRQSYRIGVRRDLTFNAIFPILNTASGLVGAIYLYASGLATRTGISVGNWYLFMQAVGYFWWPHRPALRRSGASFRMVSRLPSACFALIDAEPRVVQTGSESVDHVAGHVEFRHMRFSYTTEVVLHDFSLDIKPGETVALVESPVLGKQRSAHRAAVL